MMTRSILMAATLMSLVCTGANAAEPAKAPQTPAARPASDVAPIVLASADIDRPVVNDSGTATPVKRPRAARVTTCRCADTPPTN